MWLDGHFIKFGTTDGRDGRVSYFTVASSMYHLWTDFESHLWKALEYASEEDARIIFDNWWALIKRYIEKEVYPRHPEILNDK